MTESVRLADLTPRFSLRSLAVLVAVLAVYLGMARDRGGGAAEMAGLVLGLVVATLGFLSFDFLAAVSVLAVLNRRTKGRGPIAGPTPRR